MARVTVNVNVRDMTGGDLQRLRGRLNGLTDSMNRFSGHNSQANLAAMRDRFTEMNHEVRSLAGRIPEDEFQRLTLQVQRFGAQINRATGPNTARQFGVMRTSLREITRDLERFGGTRTVRIHAEDRTGPGLASVRRRLMRFATGPARGLGGLIGGTLSDGIGQGIVGAFKSPTFGALIVVALTAALSMVGAALAGILVFAIGGAFVGLGAFLAAKSKEVTRNWAEEMKSLKPIFEKAAEPLIPVLHRATHIMGDMGREFAPHFEQALTQVTPMLNNFIDATKRGFQKLGANAWDDLQSAFRVFLEAFGPEWEDFLSELGKSLGALARTVRDHSTEMAMALRAVLGVINFIIDAINFFANAWVMGIRFANEGVATLMDTLGMLLDFFMGMVDTMLAALEQVAKLLGFGDEVAEARKAFGELRESAVGRFTEIADRARSMGNELDYNNRKRVLEVDIASWTSELTRAKEQLKSVPPEKQSELKANIADLERKIASAQSQLAGMRKDYYVTVHYSTVGSWAITGKAPGEAHGGVAGNWGTAATGGARSNMTLVGEQGPELVDLVPGSHVRSNADTRRIMGQGDTVGAPTIVLKSSGRRVDDLLIEILRDSIHQSGGDVVKVLGGR